MSSAPVVSPYGRTLEHPDTLEPPVPESIGDTGLSEEFIVDLLLKTSMSRASGPAASSRPRFACRSTFVDDRLLSLQQRRLVEVLGTSGPNRGGYLFDLTGAGRDRAREALASSQYVGPAPVPLDQYRTWVEKQTHPERPRDQGGRPRRLPRMVLSDAMHDVLGPAINSAKSLFLYGAPGNGKTMIAETISQMLGGHIYVPYAVEVEGQIMVVYDPVFHHAVSGRARGSEADLDSCRRSGWLKTTPAYDRRYVDVRRPVVLTGGELTLDQLDLQYDHYTKMYQAPFQVKANGGVLILDDFGRQRVPPKDLLNRWIVPLEKRIDFLTLHTGGKFQVPFDMPADHLDQPGAVAAGRRGVPAPDPLQDHGRGARPPAVRGHLRSGCMERGIDLRPGDRALHLRRPGTAGTRSLPRGCHPRDILDHVVDIARFHQVHPEATVDMVDRACRSYFLDDSRTS